MDKLAAPLLALLQADHPTSLMESGLGLRCPELPEWAPPQKNCPPGPQVKASNDHYECWQGISW